jgi:hypothetical protein
MQNKTICFKIYKLIAHPKFVLFRADLFRLERRKQKGEKRPVSLRKLSFQAFRRRTRQAGVLLGQKRCFGQRLLLLSGDFIFLQN